MAGTVIVDYGMANLRSVQKAFEKVGSAAAITSDPSVVAADPTFSNAFCTLRRLAIP